MRYPLIAAQLFNVPLMAQPAAAHTFADTFIAILAGTAAIESRLVSSTDSGAPDVEAYTSRHAGERFAKKSYAMTDSGIAILPIHGAMVQRMGQLTPDCMEMTSYEKLSRRFDAMVADPDVKAILFELDTPGGQVAGNFEFARRVMAARDKKPIWAHANEHAYSAGYSIAASASRLMMADTGGVANVGVLMLHMNMTERDAKLGYEYTAFYSGARKNDFNPHFKLTSEAKTVAQDTVNRLHNTFAQHVATGRGITVDQVNASESAGLLAHEAVAGKFVDGVASFDEVISMLESELGGRSTFIQKGSYMQKQTATGPAPGVSINAAEIFAARAAASKLPALSANENVPSIRAAGGETQPKLTNNPQINAEVYWARRKAQANPLGDLHE